MLGFEHRVCDSKSLGYIILPSENKPLGKKRLSLSHLQRSFQSGVHDTKRGLIVFYHGLLGQPSSLAGVSPVLQGLERRPSSMSSESRRASSSILEI